MKTGRIIIAFIAGIVTGWAFKSIQTPKRNSFTRINQNRVNRVADYYTTVRQREESIPDTEIPDSKDVSDSHEEQYFK